MIEVIVTCNDCGLKSIASAKYPRSFCQDNEGRTTSFYLEEIFVPEGWKERCHIGQRCPACYKKWLAENEPKWKAEHQKREDELFGRFLRLLKNDPKVLASEFKDFGPMPNSNQHEKMRALVKALES